jgi:hypothetical protein
MPDGYQVGWYQVVLVNLSNSTAGRGAGRINLGNPLNPYHGWLATKTRVGGKDKGNAQCASIIIICCGALLM